MISIFLSNQCFSQIGSRLEAADNNELMKIYPAIVAGVHGRLLLIHYVQYEEDDDQIYDYRLALLDFYSKQTFSCILHKNLLLSSQFIGILHVKLIA